LRLADGSQVNARFVLDCSGRAAVFGRRRAGQCRADRLVAAYDFLRSHDAAVELTPATLIEAAADGWWYAALLPDQRLSLAYFSDPDLLPRGLAHDAATWHALVASTRYVLRWLDDAGFRIDRPPRLASAATTWLQPAAGEDWATAGDAAAAFDPLSSHGLTTALWSGRRAALAGAAALDGEPARLASYTETLGAAVHTYLAQRQAVYGRERRFADRTFWRRRQRAPIAGEP
jgi:flavin-dependent dehydrogenase